MSDKFEKVEVGDTVTVKFFATGTEPRLSVMKVVKVSKTLFTVQGEQKPNGPAAAEIRFRKFDGREPGVSSLTARWVEASNYTTGEDMQAVERQRLERRARTALEFFANQQGAWSKERSEAVLAFCNTWGLS